MTSPTTPAAPETRADDAAAPGPGPDWRIAALVLVAIGCVLHLPWLDRAFGPLEKNAGCFFGGFVQNLEAWGFGRLRGTPIGVVRLDDLATGVPYLNHPPGLTWLFWLLGSDEWQLRLPTFIGSVGSALLILRIAWRRFSPLAAFAAGLVTVVAPVLVVHSHVSYEPVLLLFALVTYAAVDALHHEPRPASARTRRAWQLALGVAAFVGPWIDWAFAFFCLGLVPLAWRGSFGGLVRALLLPAICSFSAVVLILAWRVWAEATPGLPPVQGNQSFDQLLANNVFRRPPLSQLGEAAWTRLLVCYSLPLVAVASHGAVAQLAMRPGLALAALVPGFLNPFVFPIHALSHDIYYAYLAPFVAWSVAALFHLARRLPLPVRLVAALALAVAPTLASVHALRATDTPFYRDLGRVLTEATGRGSDGGERYWAFHSYLHWYGYYVDSSKVWVHPSRDPQVFATGLQNLDDDVGVRYLWLRIDASVPVPVFEDKPGFEEFLAPFPKTRVPELETTFEFGSERHALRVEEAWLVTLRDPKP